MGSQDKHFQATGALHIDRKNLKNKMAGAQKASKQLLPLLNRVVVKRPASGTEAVVVAVGPNSRNRVSVGEKINIGENNGTTVVVEGEELMVINGEKLWNIL